MGKLSTLMTLLALMTSIIAGCVPVVIGERPRPDVVANGPRTLHVPPGHYPPSGYCRLWYAGRPPGHQPPPVRCDRLLVRRGTFILYNGSAWDADYDWRLHAKRYPGSVPRIILELTTKHRVHSALFMNGLAKG